MWVGQLMLMATNQGKRVDLEDMVKSPKGGDGVAFDRNLELDFGWRRGGATPPSACLLACLV